MPPTTLPLVAEPEPVPANHAPADTRQSQDAHPNQQDWQQEIQPHQIGVDPSHQNRIDQRERLAIRYSGSVAETEM